MPSQRFQNMDSRAFIGQIGQKRPAAAVAARSFQARTFVDQGKCLRQAVGVESQFDAFLAGKERVLSRVPDGLSFVPPGHLTPIPMDEQISSLSAILLNDEYYRFVLAGRKSKHGILSWVGEDRLIPLKAVAWLEMTERVRQGEVIDSKKINKHLNDIVQLSAPRQNSCRPSFSADDPHKNGKDKCKEQDTPKNSKSRH